jgi:hypothetical protein
MVAAVDVKCLAPTVLPWTYAVGKARAVLRLGTLPVCASDRDFQSSYSQKPALCRISAAGHDDLTTRSAADGRKAPRHEIAGKMCAGGAASSRRCRGLYGDLVARLRRMMSGHGEGLRSVCSDTWVRRLGRTNRDARLNDTNLQCGCEFTGRVRA